MTDADDADNSGSPVLSYKMNSVFRITQAACHYLV